MDNFFFFYLFREFEIYDKWARDGVLIVLSTHCTLRFIYKINLIFLFLIYNNNNNNNVFQ